MKIYRLAKKTAYIPENYDNIEKEKLLGQNGDYVLVVEIGKMLGV